MLRYIFLAFLLSLTFSYASAQKRDSLFVEQGEDGWIIRHKVKKGETIFSIARNYHIPPAMLSDANEIPLRQTLQPNAIIEIPLGAYNLKTESVMYTDEMRPLFHRLRAGESLRKIAKNSNVNQRRLLEWNNLSADDLFEGVVLKVGWLLYDATGTTLPPVTHVTKKDTSSSPLPTTSLNRPQNKILPVIDTIRITKNIDSADTSGKSEAETLYDDQTAGGVITEKGPAAFFKSNNNQNASFYYAFHNDAPKGTIIKVRNTNNGKSVYVKVLGPIPNTALYHKCIIGISSRARAALGVRDEKAWCELTYGR